MEFLVGKPGNSGPAHDLLRECHQTMKTAITAFTAPPATMIRVPVSQTAVSLPPRRQTDHDAHLRERVLQALHASGYPALRSVRCHVTDGLVTLEGVVASYFLKQLAQASALRVCETCEVRNTMDVRHP